MGTFRVSTNELIEILSECLDDVEGDFSSKELIEALEFMRWYAPTSDSSKHFEKVWHKKLKQRGLG